MDNQVLQHAADMYKTPAYVFDLDAFDSRIRYVKKMLGERIKVYYAMKANPFLTKAAAQTADGLEVCSPGEYAICRRAGIPSGKIVLSGVNKDACHIREVIKEQGARTYTAESPNQLKLLEECAAMEGTSIGILLRLTSGNQFGMDEDTVLSAIENRRAYPHLDIKGLQYYSGTQKKKLEKINQELRRLDSLCLKIHRELDFDIREMEYGPGFYVPYFQGEEAVDEKVLLEDFKKMLDSMEFKGIIVLEAGRFLAGPCGSYLTRVVDTKINQGQRYCIVDGGINHVNYYGQAMAMKVPAYRFIPGNEGDEYDAVSGAGERFTVCGSLCTSGDILVKNLPLPGLKIGDLLVFDRIGAYSVTEGIYLFLSRELPRILTYTRREGLKQLRRALPTDPINDGTACIK